MRSTPIAAALVLALVGSAARAEKPLESAKFEGAVFQDHSGTVSWDSHACEAQVMAAEMRQPVGHKLTPAERRQVWSKCMKAHGHKPAPASSGK